MTLRDPHYTTPYVDVDEWREEPVRHRYVHGGFEGTDLRFSCYFPSSERYEGRYFQPILAVSGTEHVFGSSMVSGMAGSIAFAVDSGAYMVESNLGSLTPFPGEDGTVTGYRASAAGEEVQFTAVVDAPPGTGTVVSAEWDFDGSGSFAVESPCSTARARTCS